ncbi:LutC/YkgG family protein [Nocardia terpenica]|uniref:Lactate utilization protein C n=1 Tax=Nocardia terpenica TaxID=455432 RepID=A0A291RCF9_9NOCA|nr:LUD domain-containing protein [Nocardia terpenica]ATL65246.1 lactate utilization protein C [Nocardia terpenica]
MTSREEFLRRVRDALQALPDDDPPAPAPRYQPRHALRITPEQQAQTAALFTERLEKHGAEVHRIREADIAEAVYEALDTAHADAVIAPDGLPPEWLGTWADIDGHRLVADDAADGNEADAVVSACAGAVADSGILVFDGGPGQLRDTRPRACHVCVVRAEQIDDALPEVLDTLDPQGPITWFGGPAAPEGDVTHGPRRLVVLLVE